jgi:hypothetical protein
MICTFQLFRIPGCIGIHAEKILNCCYLCIFIYRFCKLRQIRYFFENLMHFYSMFEKKCSIGFNVNSEFEKVEKFEVQKFELFNYLI